MSESQGSLGRNLVHTLHGGCLSTDDVEQVKLLISEFCIRALMPYVERQIQQLSEFVANKKGVSRSLFSATKRWFSPNKPGTTVPINNLMYINILTIFISSFSLTFFVVTHRILWSYKCEN